MLEREFPGAAAALAHVATLQGEVVEVLDALTDQILGDEQTLPLCHLRDSAPPLRPYLVKRWLARRGAPPPARPQLASILNEMLSARADGMPVVVWRDVAVRRYDERLFLTAAVLAAAHEQALAWPAPWAPWHFAHGELSAQRRLGEGLDQASLESAPLSVRYRCGGERIQLHHGGPRRALKSLFQEWRVPPWQRPCWPLLYIGDELAVVPGRAVAAEFQVERERPGVVFGWQTRDFPVSD